MILISRLFCAAGAVKTALYGKKSCGQREITENCMLFLETACFFVAKIPVRHGVVTKY
jgi:hypothetical protein